MGAAEDNGAHGVKLTAGACEGDIRVRKGRSSLFTGKLSHVVLLGSHLYCYPVGEHKPPFSELDLSAGAELHISNSTTFVIKDQTWTSYMFQANTLAERNAWLGALQHVDGLQRSLKDFYSMGKALGHGMAGRVHECTEMLTQNHYAVKEGLAHPRDDFNGAHGLLNELKIMQRIRTHPHRTLPELHDAFRTKDGMIQIVMTLMTGSNICARLASDKEFSEGQARDVFKDIVEGVAHLHSLGISHRDLKPENIFFRDKSADAQIMILDFNLAKESHRPEWGADTPCGTSPYMAPEVLQHQHYNQAVDMWALGCILHILLCGKIPFSSVNSKVQDRRVVEGDWNTDSKEWECVSSAAKDLLVHLLEPDPAQRLSAEACLLHPWLNPSSSRRALTHGASLESPAVLRRMQSEDSGGSPDSVNGWLRTVLPSGGSPVRSGIDMSTRFASLNEKMDADLEQLRKPPDGARLSTARRASSEAGSSPTAPHHHQYGSPGRVSMIDEIRSQLEDAHGAGLQDKHFGPTH